MSETLFYATGLYDFATDKTFAQGDWFNIQDVNGLSRPVGTVVGVIDERTVRVVIDERFEYARDHVRTWG